MDIGETIKHYYLEYLIAIVFGLFTYVICPKVGITDPIIVFIISATVIFLIFGVIYLIFQPCILFEFGDRNRQCILVRNEIEKRASNFSIDVFLKPKFFTLLKIFFIKPEHLDPFYYQIFWTPQNLLIVKKNQDYPALQMIDKYPAIKISDLHNATDASFSFKISSSAKHPELNQVSIKLKRIANSPHSIRLSFLLWFCKAKLDEKTILIKRD